MRTKNLIFLMILVAVVSVVFVFRATIKLNEVQASDTRIMGAEFSTLQRCLDGIERSSGETLDIKKDTPGEVSGYLSRSRGFFWCKKRVTGSKGTYFDGSYDVKVK